MSATMHSVTDIKCDFPAVLPSCTTNYAEVLGARYTIWRIIYMLTGIVGVGLCATHLAVVIKRGTGIQKACFPFLMLCAATFIVRGIDPNGYQGSLPMMISEIAWATASSCLYNVCYAIAMVWGSLLQSYGANWKLPIGIWTAGIFLMSATWFVLLFTAVQISKAPLQKMNVDVYIGTQFITLMVLGSVATAYFIYTGTVLNRRLVISFSNPAESRSTTPTNSSIEAEYGLKPRKIAQHISAVEKMCPTFFRWKDLPKITKILVLFTAAIILTIVFQALTAYQALTDGYKLAWQSYNLCLLESPPRSSCVKFDDEMFGLSQMIVMFLCIWAFWKIPEGNEDGTSPTAKGLSAYSLDLERAIDGRLNSDSSSFATDLIPSEMRISESSDDTAYSKTRKPTRASV